MGGEADRVAFAGTSRFEVVRRLGEGGMGVVYEAIDRARGTRVALKTLQSVTVDAIVRFKREFRALQDLHHPSLVTLHELFEEDGTWFFTMELVDGVPFDEWVRPGPRPLSLTRTEPDLARDEQATVDLNRPVEKEVRLPPLPPLDLRRLRPAMQQLAQAVHALHAAGKVHRDLKPSNVLVTPSGRVVVLDFGLVSDSGAEPVALEKLIGTPPFMAPEQIKNERVGPAADWYAVGGCLYLALTGRLPFSGTPPQIVEAKLSREPPPAHHLDVDAPPDLDELASELMRIDAERRPDGDEVLRRLGCPVDPSPRRPRVAPFVGRVAELAELDAALLKAREGGGRALLMTGESGVGKSALVRRFTDGLDQTTRVLRGRCYARETVPYKALDEVVEGASRILQQLPDEEVRALLPPRVAHLAQVFPVLQTVSAVAAEPQLRDTPSPSPSMDPRRLRWLAFGALRVLLTRLAALAPLVIVLEDLHWADDDSLELLVELMRAPAPPRLLVIATVRLPEGAARVAELERALGAPSELRTLRLMRLPPDDAHALATSLLSQLERDPQPPLAAEIAQAAAGHPLFIDALVRHKLDARAPGEVVLDDALGARAERLEPDARRVLEVLCVAGVPISQDVVARAAGLPFTAFATLSAELQASHLMRASPSPRSGDPFLLVEPYHDRLRQAVLTRTDEAHRRALHGRLAEALAADEGANPEALAVHFRAAGDDARASAYMLAAADEAARQYAFDRAASLYQRALERLPASRAGAVQLQLAEALANGGRGREAARAFLAAASLVDGDDHRRVALERRAGEQLLVSGHIDEGLAVMRRVLAALDLGMPETPRAALASLALRRAQIRLRGLRFRRREHPPVRALERVDACWTIASGLSLVDVIRGAELHARHLVQALDCGEPWRVCRALAAEACFSSIEGNATAKRSAELVHRARTLAGELGDPRALGVTLGAAGIVAFQEGRWKDARDLCAEAETLLRERTTGLVWEVNTAMYFHLAALAWMGRMAELQQLLPMRLREADGRGDLNAATNLRASVTNMVWLAADDPAAARAQVAEAGARWTQKGLLMHHFYEVFAHAQIDLYVGRAEAAHERVAQSFRALGRSLLLRVHFVRAMMRNLHARTALAVAAERPASAREPLLRIVRKIVRELEGEGGWAFSHATTLRAQEAWLRGDLDETQAHLEHAAAAYDVAHMPLHAQVARLRLGALRGGDEGRALVENARAWLRAEEVRVPERMADVLIPVGRTDHIPR